MEAKRGKLRKEDGTLMTVIGVGMCDVGANVTKGAPSEAALNEASVEVSEAQVHE